MSIPICYTGPYLDASGYGEATRNAIVALHSVGTNIITQRVSFTGSTTYDGDHAKLASELGERKIDYRIKIIHVTPDTYPKYIEKGKYNIGHLFWETDKLPHSWVAPCNQMDEIWTGTQRNADAIKNSGVVVPIKIFPQAIDINVPTGRPFKILDFDHENNYLFYSIIEWNERKNPRALLNAYWKAFKGEDRVGLVIKAHIGSYGKDMIDRIVNEARRWRNELGWDKVPKTYICTELLSKEQIHRLHETGNCFVSAHRGEGWGLPQAEAALHNRPIISTPVGGIHEYFNGKQLKKVAFEMVEIDKVYNKYYEPGMSWAQVDEESLKNVMLNMFEKWSDPAKRTLSAISGYQAGKLVRSMFNYEEVGKLMLERLMAIEQGMSNYYDK